MEYLCRDCGLSCFLSSFSNDANVNCVWQCMEKYGNALCSNAANLHLLVFPSSAQIGGAGRGLGGGDVSAIEDTGVQCATHCEIKI
ncbi:Oidioi.mRNA.OKI2018_I69.chr2.g4105.t1.cds [Oikopleura dioica]|uniref:Oidioi.mRNA.OKI2018_I69.chr2.g4105.t1.cds n=1 Tax=Oikopleura dioica TaxID=34765 RepID=A0ABN7T1R2_OIKDI|nr:Oidioi.mRNA.OKI2018_I69.chr2.g4105.t1.cds [Oikopleura dioica]